MSRSSRFWLLLLGTALVLQLLWEMAQMMAFSGVPASLLSKLLACGVATIGDVLYTAVLYVAGAAITKDHLWLSRLSLPRILSASAVGFASAAVIELLADATGLWRYSERMPLIPFLKVGVWPVLQFMMLPPLTFWLVGRSFDRRA